MINVPCGTWPVSRAGNFGYCFVKQRAVCIINVWGIYGNLVKTHSGEKKFCSGVQIHEEGGPYPLADLDRRIQILCGRFPFNKNHRFKFSEFSLVEWNASDRFQNSKSRVLQPRGTAGLKRRSQVAGRRSQVTGRRSQVAGHRSQVAGHRSQFDWLLVTCTKII